MSTGRRLRSVLLLVVSLLGFNTMAAQALIADQWAFAYNDNPTPGIVFTPMDPVHQWSKFGGPGAEVRTVGVGRYEVRFTKTANRTGIAHVTAVSDDPRWCQLVGWKPNSATGYEHVRIDCYKHGGVPDHSRFTVVFTASSGPGTAGTDEHAYVFANAAGTILDSYNSDGGANVVGHGGVGEWKVWLPMPSPRVHIGNLQVTAVDQKPARCKVADWFPDLGGQIVIVHCFDHNSKPYDTGWTLSYNRERPVVGEIGPPKRFGYIWVHWPLTAPTNYNSVGAVNSTTWGPGQYYVIFPKVGVPEDHVQVTAFGPGPEYCGLQTLWNDFMGDAHVRNVICFDDTGALGKSDSFVAFTSRH